MTLRLKALIFAVVVSILMWIAIIGGVRWLLEAFTVSDQPLAVEKTTPTGSGYGRGEPH